MQTTTRRFLCSAGLIAGATLMLACLSFATAQTAPQRAGASRAADMNGERFANPNLVVQISDGYDQQTRDLLSKYNAANEQSERDQLVKELSSVAAQEFDARQEARGQELKNLEEQLKKLRVLHDRRAKEKDDIVRDRVRHLLRDADGLGWGTDRIGAPGSSQQGYEHRDFGNLPQGKR